MIKSKLLAARSTRRRNKRRGRAAGSLPAPFARGALPHRVQGSHPNIHWWHEVTYGWRSVLANQRGLLVSLA